MVFLHGQFCKGFSFVVAEFHFKDVEGKNFNHSANLSAREAGADGFIIPDLPLEKAGDFEALVGDMPLIQMLAPTSPNERMEMIARNAKGFIYLVSVTGVTGARTSISDGLGDLIARVREHTSAPVCVGFGIGTPEQAKQVGALADGVIVGSACVKAIGESENPVEAARQFAREFRDALK